MISKLLNVVLVVALVYLGIALVFARPPDVVALDDRLLCDLHTGEAYKTAPALFGAHVLRREAFRDTNCRTRR